MHSDGSPSDPPLFTLYGPVTEYALDEEIGAIKHGVYPPWCIAHEQRHDRSWSVWQAIGSLLALGTRLPALGNPAVAPIRTVVVEHLGFHRRRTLVFEFLGPVHGERLWRRAEDPAREHSPDGFDPPSM